MLMISRQVEQVGHKMYNDLIHDYHMKVYIRSHEVAMLIPEAYGISSSTLS